MAATIRFLGSPASCQVRVAQHGTKLRSLLIASAFTPYNGMANIINCRGLGTCGTCAVRLASADGGVSRMGARERIRLSLPPHKACNLVNSQGQLRLACQCCVMPGASVVLSKDAGFWGQRSLTTRSGGTVQTVSGGKEGQTSSSSRSDGSRENLEDVWGDRGFDFELIRSAKPFPAWLQGEMRSNHAGETGAVMIYTGALWALRVRGSLGLSFGGQGYEDKVRDFSAEHQETEREHLVMLNRVLDEEAALDGRHSFAPSRNPAKSVFLPAWRISGWLLGAISTLWCPRGLYVTTEAVESFVETHYLAQIRRLRDETDALRGAAAGSDGTATAGDGVAAAASTANAAKDELRRMLQYCCEDEVHHKEEARERAAQGPHPWFNSVDSGWQWLVFQGSALAAGLARRG